LASIDEPTSISRVVRDVDSIFCFVTNGASNSLSQVLFPQCHDVNIESSDVKSPPVYSYSAPGTYTVYLAVNEGKADMQVECRQIEVLPIPPMSVSLDTNLCQGDTAVLRVTSPEALSFVWSPYYAIDTFDVHAVIVITEFTFPFYIVISYSTGFIVASSIILTIIKYYAYSRPRLLIIYR